MTDTIKELKSQLRQAKLDAYEQAVKDCMARLEEIKDLPADRCREELRHFVKNHGVA